MLALFKGELSYHEFMYEMTYKDMMALREARVNQLIEEKKSMDQDMKQRERDQIRNNIMAP